MDTINQFYLQEIDRADTRAYKHMIIQGIMMNFLYDQHSTAQYLIGRGKLDDVFCFIFENISSMNKDFEIKRLVIGLSALTLNESSLNLDQGVTSKFPQCMKAIVFLCLRSIEVRQKNEEKAQKQQLKEQQGVDQAVIYDEDEDESGHQYEEDLDDDSEDDWSLEDDEEANNDLYDTKLDKIDEIVHVVDMLSGLQNSNKSYFDSLMSFLDQNEQQSIGNLYN